MQHDKFSLFAVMICHTMKKTTLPARRPCARGGLGRWGFGLATGPHRLLMSV